MILEELLKEPRTMQALAAWTSFTDQYIVARKSFNTLSDGEQEEVAGGYDIMLNEVVWHDMAVGFFLGKGFTSKEACALAVHLL
jgi:hypothetical protein